MDLAGQTTLVYTTSVICKRSHISHALIVQLLVLCRAELAKIIIKTCGHANMYNSYSIIVQLLVSCHAELAKKHVAVPNMYSVRMYALSVL